MATNNSINSQDPIQVALGGTGLATTTTSYGVICAGTTATGALQVLASLGTSGQVLTSNGAAALPSFQAAPGVSSATGTANEITVSAATGSVTWSLPSAITAPGSLTTTTTLDGGTTVTAGTNLIATAGNLLLPTTSSSVGQIQINSSPVFHAFGTRNSFLGVSSGNFTLTTGSAVANTAIGSNTLSALTTGQANVALGDFTLNGLTSGNFNAGLGQDVFETLLTGSRNVGIGIGSGSSYTTSESSNILINSAGINGEDNVLRIGQASGSGDSQLSAAFIHGIRGVTTGNVDALAVLIDSAGQLGTISSSIRFKENVQDMADDSSSLMELRPITFNYKTHPGKKAFGLIAEEVLPIMPELVVYNMDGEVESVKYHDLPIMLLNELQKAVTIINDLKVRVATLELK